MAPNRFQSQSPGRRCCSRRITRETCDGGAGGAPTYCSTAPLPVGEDALLPLYSPSNRSAVPGRAVVPTIIGPAVDGGDAPSPADTSAAPPCGLGPTCSGGAEAALKTAGSTITGTCQSIPFWMLRLMLRDLEWAARPSRSTLPSCTQRGEGTNSTSTTVSLHCRHYPSCSSVFQSHTNRPKAAPGQAPFLRLDSTQALDAVRISSLRRFALSTPLALHFSRLSYIEPHGHVHFTPSVLWDRASSPGSPNPAYIYIYAFNPSRPTPTQSPSSSILHPGLASLPPFRPGLRSVRGSSPSPCTPARSS